MQSGRKSFLISVISIVFATQAFMVGVLAVWFAYVFVQSQMLNLSNILFIAQAAAIVILLIILAFRVKKQKWYLSLGLLLILWIVFAPLSSYLINHSTDRLKMVSISMQPVLSPGDYFIVDKLAYDSDLPHRGDIVLYAYTIDRGLRISRVIGLPGENIQIKKSGRVYINGELLNEPSSIPVTSYIGEWQVGPAEYFVLGDNRDSSADSRRIGMIPAENVFGKVTYIYLPLSRAGAITNQGYIP